MLLGNPLEGTIRPDARFFPAHELAIHRPAHSRVPLVTQGYGPSTITQEPAFDAPAGELDLMGKPIAAKHHDHFHIAIDISTGGCADDVFAAAPGTVTVSHFDPSGAEVIVIDHGVIDGHAYRTRYAHLSERFKFAHDPVVAGMVIGQVGDTGTKSTGCHLHFAIEKDGRAVDPWRRLAQRATVDPDSSAAIEPVEVPDVPIPASDKEYLAGKVAVVGNPNIGARVRVAPRVDAEVVRTILGGSTETWLPTCFVKGDAAFDSDRWLTRWNEGRWEFTHAINVESVTSL